MRHRECMRHLVYMRTPVRVGVADGAIDVTSTVVGKVSELGHGEASLTLRSHAPEAFATVRASGCRVPENRCETTHTFFSSKIAREKSQETPYLQRYNAFRDRN